MSVISYSNARKNFRDLIDRVNEDSEAITITTNDKNAVLLSESDYNSIMETLYLQRNSANAEHLAQSMKDYEENKINEVTLDLDDE